MQDAPIAAHDTDNFHYRSLSQAAKEKYAETILPLYKKYLLDRGFNGSILLAKNGEIVFEDYHGLYNHNTKDSITPYTPTHLASISKTFTGTTILHLWEQGRISLDDSVQRFLPQFPYHNITILELLSHRSGIPNYAYFMDNRKFQVTKRRNKRGRIVKVVTIVKTSVPVKEGFITNQDMLDFMVSNKPALQGLPNRSFMYSNTNFSLLALIIEKITHIPFPQYMKDSVFTPLGMKNTFVFSIADVNRYVPSYNYNNAPFGLEKFDCIYGDKNVYSTVRDMFLWDKALYEGSFIKRATLDMAYRPYSDERKKDHFYGLGWHLLVSGDHTIVYHNGWWHGNNTVFTRLIDDTATLIILGNKFNKSIYRAREMTKVFSNITDTTSVEEQP
jgi:CubicO group peptidase (beta-lactamase class C family)